MTTKNTILTLASMAVIGGLVFSAGNVSAYRGDPNVKGPNYSEERHEAMLKVFQSKDFEAWKNLMAGRGRVTQLVTKDNFAKFVEAHNLALQGKTEKAAKIRTELGLGIQNGTGYGMGRGQGRFNSR